jgi:hypothetical protein
MLYRLGQFKQCLESLETGFRELPDSTLLQLNLSQMLAASPETTLRDGRRAVELVKPLYEVQRSINRGLALSMALAETKRFSEASTIQEETINSIRSPLHPDALKTLRSVLESYRQTQACPEPWPIWDRFPTIVSFWHPFQ